MLDVSTLRQFHRAPDILVTTAASRGAGLSVHNMYDILQVTAGLSWIKSDHSPDGRRSRKIQVATGKGLNFIK